MKRARNVSEPFCRCQGKSQSRPDAAGERFAGKGLATPRQSPTLAAKSLSGAHAQRHPKRLRHAERGFDFIEFLPGIVDVPDLLR
jgi:hypothetical protein